MTTKPKALILRAPGTNCDLETEYAFQLAGGATERVHINHLKEQPQLCGDFQILCVPGGFSYGDDLGAGRILAGEMRHFLAQMLADFHEQDKLILGICNGFQVLIQTGTLLPDNYGAAAHASLTANDSGKFEDRWVTLTVASDRCVFLRGIEQIELPVAHAEGKFVVRSQDVLDELNEAGQLVLRYQTAPGADCQMQGTYPANPNGSQADVAGICDPTGRVFGLMPHPERFVDRVQHPRWTRDRLPDVGAGLRIFENAIGYFV